MSLEPGSKSAGALLRAAREKQGLHIAALAASIKVTPRKLEALEGDRWDELSGATFTRALAQSVCRALRIDAAPVLALLPHAVTAELDNVTGKLNAPFRERSGRDEGAVAAMAQRGLVWAGGVLLIAALATYFLPMSWLRGDRAPAPSAPPSARPASDPAAALVASAPPAVAAVASAPVPVMEVAASAPAPAVVAAAPLAAPPQVEVTYGAPSSASAAATAGVLQLSASEISWVEVRDGAGRILLSRNVLRGETIGVDGAAPLRLTIGNAAVTQVVFRGKPVDLLPSQRDNVARLELK
jgi:cytoskeleton protein RodZ